MFLFVWNVELPKGKFHFHIVADTKQRAITLLIDDLLCYANMNNDIIKSAQMKILENKVIESTTMKDKTLSQAFPQMILYEKSHPIWEVLSPQNSDITLLPTKESIESFVRLISSVEPKKYIISEGLTILNRL